MTDRSDGARAELLRREFDAGFAAAPAEPAARDDMLAVRLDGPRYLLRLSEISGLYVSPLVAPVPSAVPELLGIATVRAALVPVYDLHAFLGLAPAERPRWLVVLGQPSLGLAFAHLDAHVRVSQALVTASSDTGHAFVSALATTERGVLPVLDLRALHAGVTSRVRAAAGAAQEPR